LQLLQPPRWLKGGYDAAVQQLTFEVPMFSLITLVLAARKQASLAA
jgi:hypothetical protein